MRMHGKGDFERTLARWRVCSKTQDGDTLSRSASSAGVSKSSGLRLSVTMDGLPLAPFLKNFRHLIRALAGNSAKLS